MIKANESNSKCRLCNNNNIVHKEVKQTGFDKFKLFQYLLCRNCNSLSIENIPPNMDEYYKGYYSYSKFDTSKKVQFKRWARYALYKKQILYRLLHNKINNIYDFNLKALMKLRIKNKAKILDVGSGSGKFIYDLHNLGFHNSIGIDPYIEKTIHYQNGASVIKKDIFSLKEKFDVITFNHTLEHMDNLQNVFSKIKESLSNKGFCIIRIPNIDSYAFKKFDVCWTGIHAPYHFILPSYKAIEQLSSAVGLKIIDIQGEQVPGFFLANVENQLNVTIPETMFVKFHESHTKSDFKYWEEKTNQLIKSPKLCEWIVYYIS